MGVFVAVKLIEKWKDAEGKERVGERVFTNRMHLSATLKKAKLSPVMVAKLLKEGTADTGQSTLSLEETKLILLTDEETKTE